MSISQRIIRRKKHRPKKYDEIDFDIDQRNGNHPNYKIMDYLYKRNDYKESDQKFCEISINSTDGPYYLGRQASTVTYPIVDSCCESPKESEMDEVENSSSSSSQNGIDVFRCWDYYQVIYSEEDGDSQIRSVDCITEWEQDLDSPRVLITMESRNSPDTAEKKISIMTSGYETSPDTDPSTCVQILHCIIDYTTSCYYTMLEELRLAADLHGDQSESSFQSSLNAMGQRFSVAQLHINLITEILCQDPCFIVDHGSLLDNLKLMMTKWYCARDMSLVVELNLIEQHMKLVDKYENIEELKTLIKWLERISTVLHDAELRANSIVQERDIFVSRLHAVRDRITSMRQSKTTELDLIISSMEYMTDSYNMRDKCSRGPGLDNYHETIHRQSNETVKTLRECKEKLDLISHSPFLSRLSINIDEELLLWERLFDRYKSRIVHVINSSTNEHSIPQMSNISSHQLFYITIVLFIAIIVCWGYFLPVISSKSFSSLTVHCRNFSKLKPH